MNPKGIKLIRLIYGIIVSIMTVVSGLLLIVACLQIYHCGGEQIYTAEKVAAAFAPIAIPVYITLALVVGSFLLALFLPAEKKRPQMQKQYALLLRKAYEKADLQICNTEILNKINQEQKKRRLVLVISLALWVIGGIVFLPQACNSSNYNKELHLATDSIVAIVWYLLPCTLIPTGCSIFSAYYSRASIRRELELVKLAPRVVNKTPQPIEKLDRKLLYIRLAILALALGVITGGFAAGGTADVLAKAVAICTECVGLG
ncbi:MAG: hypothetical protein IJB47_00085 [Oscillospiraceae bacterium]|nr:hypothetical protein [Oscillospiraceae bacterium]